MKNKARLSVFALLFSFAYTAEAQIFTVKAGFSLSDLKQNGDLLVNDWDMKPGVHAGMAVEFPINSWASVEPGINYTNKGAKFETNLSQFQIRSKTSLHYLDVPVNLKVARTMDHHMRVYATAGPYIGVGIAGKVKDELKSGSGTDNMDRDVKWGTIDDDMFKRIELGATFGAGVELKMMQFGISYDLGLTNNATTDQSVYTRKNRVLKFSVGYRFGKK